MFEIADGKHHYIQSSSPLFSRFFIKTLYKKKIHQQHKKKQISTSKQNMDPIMQQKAQAMQGQSNYSGGCT